MSTIFAATKIEAPKILTLTTPTSTLSDMSSIQSTSSHASRVFTNLPRLMITSSIESKESHAFSFQDDNLNCKPPSNTAADLKFDFSDTSSSKNKRKNKKKAKPKQDQNKNLPLQMPPRAAKPPAAPKQFSSIKELDEESTAKQPLRKHMESEF